MEQSHFYKSLLRYMPLFTAELLDNPAFISYIEEQGSSKIFELSDFIMLTLPTPRTDYYKSSNFFDTQRDVTGYTNKLIDSLGFFPVRMKLDVLG